ncbi:MAG: hypothetical protein KGI71_04500, partial [Patescibacteria group bacterium]|nr:hypothetical protein [Patescibacteria group bacterium]
MQRISLRLSINGSQPVSLDGQVLRSLKSTVTTLSGAASTSIDLFLPHDTRWPLHLRSMDRIVIQAAVVNRPGPLNSDDWETIFTGLLVDVPIAEAVETGLHVPLECASMYHLLEATTETAAQHEWRYLQSQMPLGTFITMAMSQMGFVQGATFQVEGGVDTGLGLVPLDAVDSSGFAVNPQFQSWAAILASLAKIAGRELYCDESGVINYRPSHYDHSSTGDIPSERLINVQASVDTDKGLVNRVNVRYTLEEFGTGGTSVYWPPLGEDIQGYDRAHYHERLLILPAPWLQNGGDALNLAQWVLSWAMSNTRPAVVTLNFWPEARVGQVYTLEWPVGTRTDYYLASVVHQVTPGGPAVTVLGLTYGRPPGFAWNQPVVPSTFGNSNSVSGQQLGTAISASNWWVTAYTPHDPGQAALKTFNDPTYGTYLVASSGAQYFQQGWRPGSSGILYDYSIRPCGYLPGYQVPELGNVTLSYGDQAMLANGQIVQVQDTG